MTGALTAEADTTTSIAFAYPERVALDPLRGLSGTVCDLIVTGSTSVSSSSSQQAAGSRGFNCGQVSWAFQASGMFWTHPL